MLPDSKGIHDLSLSNGRSYWNAAAQSLSNAHNIRSYIPMLRCPHPPGSSKTRLNFIEDQDCIMFIAYLA